MARGTAVSSSLPEIETVQPEDDEGEDGVILFDPPEDDEIDSELSDEDPELNAAPDPDEQAALDLGYNTWAEMEAHGRRQGWRPQAQYGGAAGTWKDLATFIRDGHNYLPFLQRDNKVMREQLTRADTEVRGLKDQVAAIQGDMARLLDFSRKSDQAGYDRAKNELLAQQRSAVETGDVATFDEVGEQIKAMDKARAEDPPPVPTRPKPNGAAPVGGADVDAWVAANPWFQSDPELHHAMRAADIRVKSTMTGLSVPDQLQKAKEIVMGQHPEKFGRTRRNAPPAPALEDTDLPPPPADPSLGHRPRRPGSSQPALRSANPSNRQQDTGDTINTRITDPKMRREALEGFRRAKLSMPDLSESEYVKIWVNPHDDVLGVIAAAKGK